MDEQTFTLNNMTGEDLYHELKNKIEDVLGIELTAEQANAIYAWPVQPLHVALYDAMHNYKELVGALRTMEYHVKGEA